MNVRQSTCNCGKVICEAEGTPILCGVCYCEDCQEAGARIAASGNGPPSLDDDTGTTYLTYRRDRFRCVSGQSLLKPIKLKENALTERYVTTCCNTAMYVKFLPGHWVSAYRTRFQESPSGQDPLPAVEMRNKVARRRSGLPFPDDAPCFDGFPLRLFGRLIKARIDMVLGK